MEIFFTTGEVLRYSDPRRFGSIHYQANSTLQNLLCFHPRLKHLGPEPLENDFTANSFYQSLQTKGKSKPIKQVIMDASIVVGVGNIYASESLFRARIHPLKPASELTKIESSLLCKEIKRTLRLALKSGGTTLNDFFQIDGKPGYFKQKLLVYGKKNKPCPRCEKEKNIHSVIELISLGGRSTYFCPSCQV